MIKRNILDCMTLVGGTPLRFEGEKTYVSTGAVDCDHVDYAQTERVTYDNRPSRANLSVAEGDILFAKMCGTKKTLRIDRPLSEHLYSTGFCAVRATPFGLLIRKIAKLDHEAAMQAFSQFINDQSLNQKQIAFVHKIINHIEQNGYMENVTELQNPPFDKPISFVKLFDARTRAALLAAINKVKENAVVIAA